MAKGGTNLPPNAAQADRVLSENPNTKKNRERRAKLAAQSGTAFMELKAENANLTVIQPIRIISTSANRSFRHSLSMVNGLWSPPKCI